MSEMKTTGFTELSSNELQETEGGWILRFMLGRNPNLIPGVVAGIQETVPPIFEHTKVHADGNGYTVTTGHLIGPFTAIRLLRAAR